MDGACGCSNLSGDDTSLSGNNVSLSDNNVSLSSNNISLSGNDISQWFEQQMSRNIANISFQTKYCSISSIYRGISDIRRISFAQYCIHCTHCISKGLFLVYHFQLGELFRSLTSRWKAKWRHIPWWRMSLFGNGSMSIPLLLSLKLLFITGLWKVLHTVSWLTNRLTHEKWV